MNDEDSKFGVRWTFNGVYSAEEFGMVMAHIAELFRRTEEDNELDWETLSIHTEPERGVRFGIFGRSRHGD